MNQPYFPYYAKVYRVGGCVRDMLLGLEPRDIDYVVEHMTHEGMIDCGFEKVGAHFPVYLWGQTEYALCRREIKVGLGYDGFDFETANVKLEDDLYRRDLTINAMAMDVDGLIIDPYGGRKDLEAGILRHVSEAFAEDPVRVLRTARFAARYGFTIAPETMELMREVIGELDYVPQERIWAEVAKGLMEPHPEKMFEALGDVGALFVDALRGYTVSGHDLVRLRTAAQANATLAERAMYVTSNMKTVDHFQHYRVPSDIANPCRLNQRYRLSIMNYSTLTDENKVSVAMSMMPKEGADHLHVILKSILRFNQSHPVCDSVAMLVEDQATLKSLGYKDHLETLPKGTDVRKAVLEFRMEAIRREK